MPSSDTSSSKGPVVDRRVEQLRDIFSFLRAACRNSPDIQTFRDTLARLASPENGVEQRLAAAVIFASNWRTKVNPSELFLDFEALHLLFTAEPLIDPLLFLRVMENASDAVLELYDGHRYEPEKINKLFQQVKPV